MNHTHTYKKSHRVIARMLILTFFLESCYNFNLPAGSPGKSRSIPAKRGLSQMLTTDQQPSAQDEEIHQERQAKALQAKELTSLKSTQAAGNQQLLASSLSKGSSYSPSQSVSNQLPQPRPKPRSSKVSSLEQQKAVQASQEVSAQQRQTKEKLAKEKALAQPKSITPASRPASNNQEATHSLLREKLLAQGGHQVRFFQQEGQWRAQVHENLPAGFSRILTLPVYVEPGLSLQEVAGYSQAQQQQRIHVAFTKPSYVYVGSRGLRGGGQDPSKEKGKTYPLHQAVQKGDMDLSLRLLQENPALLEANNQYGQTPLHVAARMGHIELAQLLLQQGANLEACDQYQQTPLHVAAQEGHAELVKLLLNQGANLQAKDYTGQTPAALAQQEGHLSLLPLLAQKVVIMPPLSTAESQERQLTSRLSNILAAAQPISAGADSQQVSTPAELLKELKGVFSADNVSKLQQEENYKHALRVQQAIERLREGQGYFQASSLEETLDYVYLVHALANYYTYAQHEGKSAQALLEEAKSLLEYHAFQQTGGQKPLASYSKEELYQELKQAEKSANAAGLAAMYARVLYSLARSLYFYQKPTPAMQAQAKQYFELTKYVAKQENLFEAILSDRNGLAIIKRDEVKAASSPEEAKKKLEEILALYQALAQDTSSYIRDYNPGVGGKELNLQEDTYYQLECKEQVARCYEELAGYTTEPSTKAGLIGQGLSFLSDQGIGLEVLEQEASLRKKSASIYNTIGRLVHGLWQAEVQGQEAGLHPLAQEGLLNKLGSLVGLPSGPGMELSELAAAFYQQAINKSQETEFARGDGLYGLGGLCEASGKLEEALGHYQEALQVYEAISHAKTEKVRSKVEEIKNQVSSKLL